MIHLKEFITLDNFKNFYNPIKQVRYRNNIIFSIGFNENKEIEIGPLLSNYIVRPSESNIHASEIALKVCSEIKKFIFKSELPVLNQGDGFWRHIQIRDFKDKCIVFLELVIKKNTTING